MDNVYVVYQPSNIDVLEGNKKEMDKEIGSQNCYFRYVDIHRIIRRIYQGMNYNKQEVIIQDSLDHNPHKIVEDRNNHILKLNIQEKKENMRDEKVFHNCLDIYLQGLQEKMDLEEKNDDYKENSEVLSNSSDNNNNFVRKEKVYVL